MTRAAPPRNDHTVPMDVDVASTMPPWKGKPKLTDEERECCKCKGHCFRCMAQGHLSSKCPKKPAGAPGGAGRVSSTPKINNATTSPLAAATPAPVLPPIAPLATSVEDTFRHTIKAMTREQRRNAISEYLMDGSDDKEQDFLSRQRPLSEAAAHIANMYSTSQSAMTIDCPLKMYKHEGRIENDSA
ncbi:hypothetical protein EDB83DRAFT_2511648 [Lactarius deliciosus]|nr:hypothetical protein EDB83DRAFT_2511648 [Lactarius deliciosus]